jgi:hypothetical protein
MPDETTICPDGPFEVDVIVYITDGVNTGKVKVGLAKGKLPTATNITLAIEEAKKAAKECEMRLMNRHEFMKELLGVGSVAVPGPVEFPGETKQTG